MIDSAFERMHRVEFSYSQEKLLGNRLSAAAGLGRYLAVFHSAVLVAHSVNGFN